MWLGLLTLRSISERSFPVPCYSLAGLVPATIGRNDAGVPWDAFSRSGRFEVEYGNKTASTI